MHKKTMYPKPLNIILINYFYRGQYSEINPWSLMWQHTTKWNNTVTHCTEWPPGKSFMKFPDSRGAFFWVKFHNDKEWVHTRTLARWWWPLSAASWAGVKPLVSLTRSSFLLPAWTRTMHTSKWPLIAAQCKGVHPRSQNNNTVEG
jgi:hypothetical protein